VVWLDYVTARTLAPERVDLRIGVPMLLAFIPQNVFYAINNDVLSPICFGALFLCLLPWLRAKTPGFSLGALSGLGIAATYLTKLSKLPLVTVALVAIIAKLVSLMRQRPSAGLMASTALILCSAIPVGQVADGFYAISSLVVLGAAIIGLRKRAGLSAFQRQAISIAILSFVTSVGFLALLSIQFDFGSCINPSRGHPYFTSGRLLSNALIPFALLYFYGISSLLRRVSAALPLVALAAIVTFVTASEILINRVVFASEHNGFIFNCISATFRRTERLRTEAIQFGLASVRASIATARSASALVG
jgi:hypothetical protein